MFGRAKKSGAYEYLQRAHNARVDGKVRPQVIATLGRGDVLQARFGIRRVCVVADRGMMPHAVE